MSVVAPPPPSSSIPTEAVQVLYRNEDYFSQAELDEVLHTDNDELVRYEVGLCSEVLVPKEPEDEELAPHRMGRCIVKRVIREEQCKPHNVDEEIRLLARLDHPGIVKLLGAFEDDRCPFSSIVNLVLDRGDCTLLDLYTNIAFQPLGPEMEQDTAPAIANRSESLCQRLFREATGPRAGQWLECLMAIARDTLEAMRYLHDVARVAHRDVKPSNIALFTQKGSPFPRPVLIDFGTAQSDVSVRGPGGNGQEKQESCVGTGAYRAPETLFAPSEGYDAVKVDMWEWATTVIEGFLQLEAIIEDEDEEDGLGYEDEFGGSPDRGNALKDLEQALWADDDGQSWSDARVPRRKKSSLAWEYNRGPADASKSRKVIKTYRRKTLFEGNRGDLGLAGSIFALRELPSATKEGEELWPESVNFQPSLRKMPFVRRPPAPGGLRGHLEPIFSKLMQSDELTPNQKQILDRTLIDLLDSCLQLSASKRPSASQALHSISNTSQ